MPPGLTPLEQLALLLVPERDREPLAGDLLEDGITDPWLRLGATAAVGIRYQCEPYRDDRSRIGILLLLAGGMLLLRLFPAVARTIDFRAFDGLVWHWSAVFWEQHLGIAATMAGLLTGRTPWIPDEHACARWHVAVALAAIVALQAASAMQAVVLATLLLGATHLATRARRSAAPPGAIA